MSFFWVQFEDRKPGCIEGERKDAKDIAPSPFDDDDPKEAEKDARTRAEKFGKVRSLDVIPYPADPRLDVRSDCPSFCFRPHQCIGNTSCPWDYACSE